MFFCIELIKINITKEALQSICEEATYLTIAHDWDTYSDLITKIGAIIEKYRPSFIPQKSPQYNSTPYPVIRYWIQIYTNLNEMLSAVPYGGMSVFYPREEDASNAANHYCHHLTSAYIPVNNMAYGGLKVQWEKGEKWFNGELNPNNYVLL